MFDQEQHDEANAVGGFLRAYLNDLEEGEPRPLDHYKALHPGHEEAIVREFASLSESHAVDSDLPRAFGPYLLREVVGQGGQAVVYRAEDTRLGREVALKVLEPIGDDPEAVLRMRREAAVASRLDHPAICTVFEAGVHGREPFIAMRRIEGETLSSWIDRRRRKREGAGETPSEVRSQLRLIMRLFVKVARGLDAAHQADVLHRDVKPGNIMITPDLEPVIVDFGLARLQGTDLPTLTRAGQLFGTPSYLAPERLADKPSQLSEPAADIWSLGVSLFEALTLRRPFDAPTREGLVHAILTSEPPNPRRLAPAIGRDLATVLETILRKDPAQRYRTAGDVASELEAVLEGRVIRARRTGMVTRGARWVRRNPGASAAILSLCVAFAALSGWYGYFVATREALATVEAQRHRAEVERHLENGFVEMMSWNLESARPYFEKTLALDSGNVEALGGLALALMLGDAPEDAVAVLDREPLVVRTHPALNAIRSTCVLMDDGGSPSTRPKPATLMDAEGHFLMCIHLLNAATGSQGTEDAYAHARRAVFLTPSEPRPLYHMAASLTATKIRHHRDARLYGEAAVRMWPQSPLARFTLAHALIYDPTTRRDQLERAGVLMENVRDLIGAEQSLYVLGALQSRLGKFDDAIRSLRQSQELRDHRSLATTSILSCLRRAGRHEQAVKEGLEAIARRPEHSTLVCEVAMALMALGRADEARELCRTTLSRTPGHPEVTFVLGELLIADGKAEKALELVEPVLRRLSHNLGRFVRARALQELGRHLEADHELSESLRLHPNPVGFVSHAMTLIELGRITEAIEKLDHAERLEGRTPRTLQWRAAALFANGEIEAAISVQEELIALLAKGGDAEVLRAARQQLRRFQRDL